MAFGPAFGDAGQRFDHPGTDQSTREDEHGGDGDLEGTEDTMAGDEPPSRTMVVFRCDGDRIITVSVDGLGHDGGGHLRI